MEILLDQVAVTASVAIPLAMTVWPASSGAFQRLMFAIAYARYGREAFRAADRFSRDASVPDPSRTPAPRTAPAAPGFYNARPHISEAVLGSIQNANDLAMAWLEDHAAYGRIGGEQVKATGWMTASFRHLTSRALDPFPHHHNVVANTVTLPDGTHRGLDARGLYRHAQAASALATAEMRYQLSLQLGVRWRPGRKTGWEIAGIDDRVIAAISHVAPRWTPSCASWKSRSAEVSTLAMSIASPCAPAPPRPTPRRRPCERPTDDRVCVAHRSVRQRATGSAATCEELRVHAAEIGSRECGQLCPSRGTTQAQQFE